jgi:hypothetical protein
MQTVLAMLLCLSISLGPGLYLLYKKAPQWKEAMRKESERQERLMQECLEDKKEYECEALLSKKKESSTDVLVMPVYY